MRRSPGWKLVFFKNPTMTPCKCHPYFLKHRLAYLKEKYGADSEVAGEIKNCKSGGIDFGGMVRTDDPFVDVRLSPGREFTCYLHHADLVCETLEEALKEGPRSHDHGYYVFSTHPGMLVFLSKRDVKRVIQVLKPLRDPVALEAHKAAMRDVLVEANLAITPKPGEKKPSKAEMRASLGFPSVPGDNPGMES